MFEIVQDIIDWIYVWWSSSSIWERYRAIGFIVLFSIILALFIGKVVIWSRRVIKKHSKRKREVK